MNLIKFLREWFWARQRAIDLDILWPICKEQAGDLDIARSAFAVHALNDPCWFEFYGERLADVIEELQ